MGIALVHHFKTEVRTVEDVSPGVDDTTLAVQYRLVEVETIQVERHRGHTQSGEPDANHRPCTQEEVQSTGVVERSVLEDETTEVAVGCNDVVGLFFLTEFVAVVLGLVLGGLTYQGRGHQRTVHCGEQSTTEDTSHTQHVEGVHQDVVLSLEHDHEVEGSGDSEGHAVGEGTLTHGVDEEDCGCCGYGCRVSNTDPRTHAEAVAQFPLTTHVAEDADQEVEDYELVRTTVVQPLIEGSSFPDGVEVQADGVGGRNNSTRDDVVAVEQGTGDGLADTIDVHGGRSDEGDDVAGGCGEQGGDHQYTEPTDVEAVVGAGDPLTEAFPRGGALLGLDRCCHFRNDGRNIYTVGNLFGFPVSL